MSAPRLGTSPVPRAFVPFLEDSSLWPYPRALDDHDDIVELNFADISALSNVDVFERRLPNGRNGAKQSKRDEGEGPRGDRTSVVCARKEHYSQISTPDCHMQQFLGDRNHNHRSHLAVECACGSAVASPLPRSQSGAGSSVKPSQPNSTNSASALVKTPDLSSSIGGPSTAPPSSNNKSKAKSIPNGPNGKASTPATTQVQTNGAATLIKSAAGAAIVEVVRAHPNGNGSSPADRNEFVREVLTLIHVRAFFSFHLWLFVHFLWFDSID